MVSTLEIEGHRILHTNEQINKKTPMKLHLKVNDNHTFFGRMHLGGNFGSNVKVWGVIITKPHETKLRFAHALNHTSSTTTFFYNLSGHGHNLHGYCGELPKRPAITFTKHQYPNKAQFEKLVAYSNHIDAGFHDGKVHLHVGTLHEDKKH